MKEYTINIEGTDFNVVIGNVSDGAAEVEVNGEKYEVNFTGAQEEKSPITAEGFVPAAGVVKNGAEAQVTSPLPGIVVELCVKEGQAVRTGDKVAVVEAMKMENDIFAERDGTVGKVCVAKGDSVLEGAVLMTIE